MVSEFAMFRRRRAGLFLGQQSCPRTLAWLIISLLAPLSRADSSAWKAVNSRDTGVAAGVFSIARAAPGGEIFVAAGGIRSGDACAAPTLKLGDAAMGSSCVSRFNASGRAIFAVQIGGANITAMALDPSGNVYVSGVTSAAGFATTANVYEPQSTGASNGFLCKLSGVDGHPAFCTFVDVAGSANGLAVDSSGGSYIAGACGDSPNICVQHLNATGTQAVYRATFDQPPPSAGNLAIAVDASSNLWVLFDGLAKLSPSGGIAAVLDGLDDAAPIALALDANGNPQVLLADDWNRGNFRTRRYDAALGSTMFDAPFSAGSGSSTLLAMAIDASGTASIVGNTSGVDLPQIHPSQACMQPGSHQDTTSNLFLVRVDDGGNMLQSTYLHTAAGSQPGAAQASITSGADSGAVMLWSPGADVMSLSLGPADEEISLACAGNAASLLNSPFSPNEIASVFGTGLGPASPIVAQPAEGIYPFQLGGVEISFDGVAAPLLYVSGRQVSLVTPETLLGKSTTTVCAAVDGVTTNCFDAPVQAAAPGIFGSGTLYDENVFYAAAVNQDGTVNSSQSPAAPGSIVALFVTGLGSMTPCPPDGALTPIPLPLQNMNIQVDFAQLPLPGWFRASAAEVLYAGPAPLAIEGLGQINVRVPSGASSAVGFRIRVVSPDGTQTFSSPGAVVWVQ